MAKAKATITYKVSPEGSGTLTSYSETLAPINGVAKGSTATANDNYVFKGWFNSNGNKVSIAFPTLRLKAEGSGKMLHIRLFLKRKPVF